ncbi:MAG: hypothetical protein ACT4PV_00350 [Planctomycetaceae bacterium]
MKVVWIAVTALVVVLGGASLWLYFELDSIGKRYDREFAAASETLRALDGRFPYTPQAELAPDRFDAYLRARAATGEVYARRSKESSSDLYHGHGTQIEMLGALAAALERESMSLEEYVTIGRRLRVVLAAAGATGSDPALAALASAWRTELATQRSPEGPPLPEPGAPPPPSDTLLVSGRAPAIRASMQGDMLILIVERIALGR